jgi:hypothetical protein
MPFRNADAIVPEKDRDSIERNTREQQFDGEGVAELMRMTLGYFREFKNTLQPALPFSLCAVDLRMRLSRRNTAHLSAVLRSTLQRPHQAERSKLVLVSRLDGNKLLLHTQKTGRPRHSGLTVMRYGQKLPFPASAHAEVFRVLWPHCAAHGRKLFSASRAESALF